MPENGPDHSPDPSAVRQSGRELTTSFDAPTLPAPDAPTLSTSDSPVPPPLGLPNIPGYEVEAEIARGGMGIVYKARHVRLNRPAALKLILAGKYQDTIARLRFLIEAEAVAQVRHPHVVTVYEFGQHDDLPFLAMEFVSGGTLARRIRTFTPRVAAELVAKLADGVVAAHAKGVVHRDLKPANVLLTEDGEPKITDFGLAKVGDSGVTVSGAVMGTPSYMSPEQASGKSKEIGTPTDVYALGAILYELLAGHPPFQGSSTMETIQRLLTMEPLRLRSVVPGLSRDLETICMKCLEKEPRKRYTTAAQLAADLRAFLAGRPIAARPVGPAERVWKWSRRNPAKTAAMAAAVVVLAAVAVGGLVIRQRITEQRDADHAAALVRRLLDADTAQAPAIVEEMGPYRKWIDPQLHQAFDAAPPGSRQKLHAGLALLPVDSSQVEYLFGRLLEASPSELPVIRAALDPQRETLRDRLWAIAEQPETGRDQRLRAAAVLATYDSQSAHWATIAPAVVEELVRENPIFLGRWSEAFRPVRQRLAAPLAAIFADRSPDRAAERSVATNLLADYTADKPDALARLLLDADAKQFAALFPAVSGRGEESWPVLLAALDEGLPGELPSSDPMRDTLAKRQANAAVALLRMNRGEAMWRLLQHSADPRVRSELIHRLAPLQADPGAIARRLDHEPDLSSRRALLLVLGEFNERELPAAPRATLLPKLMAIYRDDPDPGLHAATEWLLRVWQQEAWLRRVNDEWAANSERRKAREADIRNRLARGESRAPQWYVNGQAQTFVVLPGPVEFRMGSPPTEVDRERSEIAHIRRINRTFAIASKSVTLAEYRRLTKDDYQIGEKYTRDPDFPVVAVSWYMAAKYCNLLSQAEGIPESEWSYETDTGGVMRLKENYLSLTGYRLPTEAEFEYAARAGATTSRYYGESDELLRHYAWYTKSSGDVLHRVGWKKPNDFGLFDVYGNCFTWCQEPFGDYPETAAEDREVSKDRLAVGNAINRGLRGGAYHYQSASLRSAYRNAHYPISQHDSFGFRPARTIKP